MKIKITLEDIRNAKEETRKWVAKEVWHYCRAETCPLAFALKRLFPGKRIYVSTYRVYFGRQHIKFTKSIAAFIKETDKKKDRIRPRELEIDLDAPAAPATS